MFYYGLSHMSSRYFKNVRHSEDPVLSMEEQLGRGWE